MMGPSVEPLKDAFNHIGWFIPPYISLGFLWSFKAEIDMTQPLDEKRVAAIMARIYEPIGVAVMVRVRYPETPFVQDYQEIIAESVEAHFSGLGHAAFLGLLPVIEGAGRKLAQSRSLPYSDKVGVKSVFAALASDLKHETVERSVGAVDELLTMIDSFIVFIDKYFYVHSSFYPLSDNTTRHGPSHGAFGDKDYGGPINFYKAIGAIDFLCTVAAFRAHVSWLAPTPTYESNKLALHYLACRDLATKRPTPPVPPSIDD